MFTTFSLPKLNPSISVQISYPPDNCHYHSQFIQKFAHKLYFNAVLHLSRKD